MKEQHKNIHSTYIYLLARSTTTHTTNSTYTTIDERENSSCQWYQLWKLENPAPIQQLYWIVYRIQSVYERNIELELTRNANKLNTQAHCTMLLKYLNHTHSTLLSPLTLLSSSSAGVNPIHSHKYIKLLMFVHVPLKLLLGVDMRFLWCKGIFTLTRLCELPP